MYTAKEKVVWLAVTSRLLIIILQFIFNIILPDHDARVFISPSDTTEEISVYDRAVDFLFSGFFRWDAQYFLHIAKYGYTYENILAFSPLYPMSIRCLSTVLKGVFLALNYHSTMVLAALMINFICFVKSTAVFYDLSKIVLKDTALAYKAAVLYCVNPASIFFSAFYSESMYALITFQIMLAYVKNNPYVYFPIGLSTLVRSNGLTNIGFPIYSWVRSLLRIALPRLSKKYDHQPSESPLPYGCTTMLGSLIWLVNIVFLSIVPYILLQLYNYSLFCFDNEIEIPHHVLKYGQDNQFLIVGRTKPEWCSHQIPLSYSYVQKKYWNVGFMQYYEFKKIPNFVLAFPILYVMLRRSIQFMNEHRVLLYTIGSFSGEGKTYENSKKKIDPSDMFVFVIHGLFLTLFCILYVHIEVSTRLLCAASPLLYWYCALDMSHKSERRNENSTDFEFPENLSSKWKVFFLTQKKYSRSDILILSYFLGYSLIGCLMFSNFLPWT